MIWIGIPDLIKLIFDICIDKKKKDFYENYLNHINKYKKRGEFTYAAIQRGLTQNIEDTK